MSYLPNPSQELFRLLTETRDYGTQQARDVCSGMLTVWAILRMQAEIDAGVRDAGSIS